MESKCLSCEFFWKTQRDESMKCYEGGSNGGMIFYCTVYEPRYTSDAVEVVRCKDCKYYREEPSQHVDDAVVVWCDAGHYPTSKVMPDDWFCAGGQRRE